MDIQVKAGSLVRTIAEREISGIVAEIVCQLCEELTSIIADFLFAGISAVGMFEFESRLAECVRELARKILQWLLANLEPELEKLPGAIKQKEQSYRRLTGKTERKSVATSFRNIGLRRARYRRGRGGKTIFPLELLLGIDAGFTPAVADVIGKQFATSGSSQGRTREMILERFGVSVGNEKLRKLASVLAESFEPLRESTQVQELMHLIKSVRDVGKRPYFLSVVMASPLALLRGVFSKWLGWQAFPF